MKLLYDASTSLLPLTGVGRYTTELLRALLDEWPAEDPPPTVWLNSLRRRPSPERHAFLRAAAREGRARVVRTRIPGPCLLAGWDWFNRPFVETIAGRADVVHCPASYILPARAAARVVTIHDLHAVRHPADGALLGAGYLAGALPDRLPEVEAILVPSVAVRGEVLTLFPRVHPERLHVVPEGVNPRWFHVPPPPRIEATLRRRAIAHPYLLAVGTLEPRKNYARLFEAVSTWRREPGAAANAPLLVVVGRPGWGGVTLQNLCRQSGLDPRRVRWIADADDDELLDLYGGARAVVVPSLWEGFGLPALEAMAAAKPLVVSNQGALPEVVGDTAAVIDPRDPRDLLRALRDLCEAPDEHRKAMGEKARERARQFTWSDTARATFDVYRRVAKKNSGPGSQCS